MSKTPIAEYFNAEPFQGEWTRDGNCITQNHDKEVDSEVKIRCGPIAVVEKIGEQIATFCRFAKRLWIDPHPPNNDSVPEIFVSLNDEDLKESNSTLIHVEVVDNKGRIARATLSLSNKQNRGWYAELVCQGRNSDKKKQFKMTFIDWNK